MKNKTAPHHLRCWFVISCAAYILLAIPRMMASAYTDIVCFSNHYPVTAIMAGDMLGIGIDSGVGHKLGVDVFQGFLDLKIIWSLAAVVALNQTSKPVKTNPVLFILRGTECYNNCSLNG